MSRWRFFHHRRPIFRLAGSLSIALAISHGSPAAGDVAADAGIETTRQQIIDKGLLYLAEQGQSDAGTFSDRVGAGVTALAVTSALRNGRSPDDPMVAAGLAAMEKYVQTDGGIYGSGRLKNYETCVGILCFSAANQGGKYDQILQRAKDFVTGLQYGRADRDPSDPDYGGASYDGEGRPDLSNTGYLIEALRALDTPASDPAIEAALQFVSRCQNLDAKYNDTPYAAKVDDGGFYYRIPETQVDPSTSPERYTPEGGLRSYGSMTYNGLKSMIYAGLTAEDPRVKAAVDWIQQHYDVSSNPGMGSAGLYYYYHTFAAALRAVGAPKLEDAAGKSHDWRADLVAELAKRQNPDGSWSNENRRWMENDKNLATAFALLALAHCAPNVSGP